MSQFSEERTTSPLWNLPIDDSRCVNSSCYAFIVEYNKSQQRYANSIFLNYGEWTVIFYSIVTGMFSLLYFYRRLRDFNRNTHIKEKVVAAWRWVMYRRLSGPWTRRLDASYGQLAILIPSTVFVLVLPFYEGFFIRERFRYGSPPLAVRCAMMLSAMLPPLVALGGKVNVVTMLTGISYTKLNIWHRFLAYMVFILGFIHSVPHIYAPIKEGGTEMLIELFRMQKRDFSGIIIFAEFAFLVLLSLPYCRRRDYEFFKFTHILLAIVFGAMMFWHENGLYPASYYLYAAIALWIGTTLGRIIHRNRFFKPLNSLWLGFPATLESLPDDIVRVVVSCPPGLTWRPGQHCFISIPGISIIGNHPFTILSLSSFLNGDVPTRSELVLLIQERNGFTRKLGSFVRKRDFRDKEAVCEALEKQSSALENTRAWIEGPYGDYHGPLHLQYECVICVGGGTGITALVPWLLFVTDRMRTSQQQYTSNNGQICKTKAIRLVWSIKHYDWVNWVRRELVQALRAAEVGSGRFEVYIYVTAPRDDEMRRRAVEQDLLGAAGVHNYDGGIVLQVHCGRPNYFRVLPPFLDRQRNKVIGCGPGGLKTSLANSVARLQNLVLKGTVAEISLHTETFGW